MEEISTNSDERVVDDIVKTAEEILCNIMGSLEKIETIGIPEKIKGNPSLDSEEPALEDVNNWDKVVTTNLVERLVEASRDIAANIRDLSPEEKTTDNSPDTLEELPNALDNKESWDNDDAISGVGSLVMASQDIIENIMERNTDSGAIVDYEKEILQ